ncbi:Long-chain-fatty-acid--CoA ligase [[Actinomadura] parvosata subsp. kistnae]|nr:Long-chain-fatty-acid--CoA ligase [Actinomadura parvosata subsp. kistnae]
MTYAELDVLSDAVAEGLAVLGVRPGDAVGLQLPNIPEFVVAYFGILKNGAVVVPLNPLLKAREVAYCLGGSRARALITWTQRRPTVGRSSPPRAPTPRPSCSPRAPPACRRARS